MPIHCHAPPAYSSPALVKAAFSTPEGQLSPLLLAEEIPYGSLQRALDRTNTLIDDPRIPSLPIFNLLKGSCMLELSLNPGTAAEESERLLKTGKEEIQASLADPRCKSEEWVEGRRLLADWPIFEARAAHGASSDGENIPLEARQAAANNLFDLYDDSLIQQKENIATFISGVAVIRALLDREEIVQFASTFRESRSAGRLSEVPPINHHVSYAIVDSHKVPIHTTKPNAALARTGALLFLPAMLGVIHQKLGRGRAVSGSPTAKAATLLRWIRNGEDQNSQFKLTILDGLSQVAAKTLINTAAPKE